MAASEPFSQYLKCQGGQLVQRSLGRKSQCSLENDVEVFGRAMEAAVFDDVWVLTKAKKFRRTRRKQVSKRVQGHRQGYGRQEMPVTSDQIWQDSTLDRMPSRGICAIACDSFSNRLEVFLPSNTKKKNCDMGPPSSAKKEAELRRDLCRRLSRDELSARPHLNTTPAPRKRNTHLARHVSKSGSDSEARIYSSHRLDTS